MESGAADLWLEPRRQRLHPKVRVALSLSFFFCRQFRATVTRMVPPSAEPDDHTLREERLDQQVRLCSAALVPFALCAVRRVARGAHPGAANAIRCRAKPLSHLLPGADGRFGRPAVPAKERRKPVGILQAGGPGGERRRGDRRSRRQHGSRHDDSAGRHSAGYRSASAKLKGAGRRRAQARPRDRGHA